MATATASGASGVLGKGALRMFSMPTANRPDFTTRATNCALLTISVVCVCVLVVCGVMIVREYALAKGYHASSCRIANIDYSPNDIACMFCGPGPKSATKEKGSGACKHSRFPCVRIKVNFTMDGHQREGLLHPDSLQAASPYAQCSFTICLKKPDDNVRAVAEYAQQWRDRGETPFKCFVDTSDQEDVIVSKMHSMEDVVHSMLWPSVIIVVCGSIFLHLEMKRRGIDPCPCITCCRKRAAHDGTEEGGVAHEGGPEGCPNSVLLKCQPAQNAGEQCKIECKLLKCSDEAPASYMSNSLTALDRLMSQQQQHNQKEGSGGNNSQRPGLAIHNGKIGTSVSAEGLRSSNTPPGSSGSGRPIRPGLQPLNIADSKDTTDASSVGSRVMGLETPV